MKKKYMDWNWQCHSRGKDWCFGFPQHAMQQDTCHCSLNLNIVHYTSSRNTQILESKGVERGSNIWLSIVEAKPR